MSPQHPLLTQFSPCWQRETYFKRPRCIYTAQSKKGEFEGNTLTPGLRVTSQASRTDPVDGCLHRPGACPGSLLPLGVRQEGTKSNARRDESAHNLELISPLLFLQLQSSGPRLARAGSSRTGNLNSDRALGRRSSPRGTWAAVAPGSQPSRASTPAALPRSDESCPRSPHSPGAGRQARGGPGGRRAVIGRWRPRLLIPARRLGAGPAACSCSRAAGAY